MKLFGILFCLLLLDVNNSIAQSYTGPGGIITDDGAINDFTLTIDDLPSEMLNADYGLVSVCLNISHSWISDLDIRLITPSGENIMLTSGQGGDTDYYYNTCFTNDASTHILNGVPPYNGNFLPFTPLGNVNNGQSGNGTWTIKILDTYAYADGGDLVNWILTFGENAPLAEPFAGTKLPILMLTTDNQTIPNEPKIDGRIKVISNEVGALNYPDDTPSFESYMAIEVRGSSSQSFPKKSFGFETQDEEGKDLETELLGLPKEEDWILYAPYTDKSMLRDALAYQLGNDIGRYAPHTRECEVFINGDYHGVYWLEEKIKRDRNRVDIKKLNPVDTIGDALTGGYLLKVDRDDGEGTYFVSQFEGTFPDEEIRVVYEDPEGEDLHPKQKAYISGFYNAFEQALYGDSFTDPILGYRGYIDVGSALDYFIICELGHNADAYRLSTFFYKDRNSVDSLFHFGPLWDFNLAFGNVDYCESQYVEGWAYEDSGGCSNTPLWWARFLEDPYYQDRLRCRFDSLRETVLSTGSVMHYLDSMATQLDASSDRNYDRWPILGMYIWPNYFIGDTYQEEVNYMKQWVNARLAWMDDNIPGECIPVTGIADVDHDHFTIVPNPATTSFKLEAGNESVATYDVSIITSSGITCLTRSALSANESIDISSLAPGMYTVTVRYNQASVHQMKLVITH
jgi:subtilisin-like proprotein convertase family protein